MRKNKLHVCTYSTVRFTLRFVNLFVEVSRVCDIAVYTVWTNVWFWLGESNMLFFEEPVYSMLVVYSRCRLLWKTQSSAWLKELCHHRKLLFELGSVAGPVIQANGRLSFEDDLRSGGLLYCVSQWTSVRTELADSMVTLGEPRDG